MSCEHTRQLAAELALGIADGADRAQALQHLAECAECRRAVEDLGGPPTSCSCSPPSASRRSGSSRAWLARLQPAPAATAPRPLRRRRGLLAAAASVAVAATATAAIVLGATSDDRRLAGHYRAALAAAHGRDFEAARLRAPTAGPRGRRLRLPRVAVVALRGHLPPLPLDDLHRPVADGLRQARAAALVAARPANRQRRPIHPVRPARRLEHPARRRRARRRARGPTPPRPRRATELTGLSFGQAALADGGLGCACGVQFVAVGAWARARDSRRTAPAAVGEQPVDHDDVEGQDRHREDRRGGNPSVCRMALPLAQATPNQHPTTCPARSPRQRRTAAPEREEEPAQGVQVEEDVPPRRSRRSSPCRWRRSRRGCSAPRRS